MASGIVYVPIDPEQESYRVRQQKLVQAFVADGWKYDGDIVLVDDLGLKATFSVLLKAE